MLSTDRRYGVDDETQRTWEHFQAVANLVATELSQMRRGTAAYHDNDDAIYFAVEKDGQYLLASAPVCDGVALLESAYLVHDNCGLSVEELSHKRECLQQWLFNQTTISIPVSHLRISQLS